MERLTVVTEGGIHMGEYLLKNGLFPNNLVLSLKKFKEMSPYLGENDEVLVIIKGLTDFTLADFYALLNELGEIKDNLLDITIMSNVELGKIFMTYYRYYGDLFYGSVVKVENGRIVDINGGAKNVKGKSDRGTWDGLRGNVSVNEVMQRYKKYNKRDVKMMIYGDDVNVGRDWGSVWVSDDKYLNRLVWVDLYK